MATEKKEREIDAVSVDFPAFLKDIRRGEFLFECAQKQQELIKAIKDTRKGGKLTITLDIKPYSPSASEVEVDGRCDIKAPLPARTKSIFFTTKANTCQREDPRQRDFITEGEI